MKYALIREGTVIDIVSLEAGVDPLSVFSAQLQPTACGDEVEIGWLVKGKKFEAPAVVAPSLEVIKAARIAVLRAACEATITGGFKSSALGSAHTYPSDMRAQINLMGSVTDSIMPDLPANWTTPFWVCDEAGSWAWKMHGAAQIQQAGRDGKAHIVECQTTLETLTATVMKAETQEIVDAIVWPGGAEE
ncbi:hypothetical protein O9X99_16680 [Agrobacterium salinitolerans]|uniref:DUF4376 domain-containing protein n=1 Tax=Agrobacterium salinitolerans TaxID=1183413 RepID=UPI0022B8234C|nr:hypothetical protein [Agrobacterium salinitolerans]MCZ7893308.1 hypothetical protein [Agrobacterium salinitolerans]